MTIHNWPQERLDELSETEDTARDLLERTLRLAGRRLDHDQPADQVLCLAVRFHRRATWAAAEQNDFTAYLERMDGR